MASPPDAGEVAHGDLGRLRFTRAGFAADDERLIFPLGSHLAVRLRGDREDVRRRRRRSILLVVVRSSSAAAAALFGA